MLRLFLAAAAAAFVCGGAQAATCPAFPPPVVKFVPLPSDVERDTSKTAKELAAVTASAKPVPSRYEHVLSAATARSVSTQKEPDGTVCAALHEIDFKLGIGRKIYIAQEFAADGCVADTIADIQAPLVKSDGDILAAFGAAIEKTYGAEINAIGVASARSSDEAQKPLLDKMSAVMKDKIFPAFSQEVTDADDKVDLTKWQKASCNGATDKAFASINANPKDVTRPQNPTQAQAPRGSGYGAGASAGRY